jgi:hypothetical protein
MGSNKGIRVYDNHGKTADRYTIVFPSLATKTADKLYGAIAVTADGHYEHTTATPGRHLGNRILLQDVVDGKEEGFLLSLIESELSIKRGATLEYFRQPTPSEIRFGEGATHVIDYSPIMAFRGYTRTSGRSCYANRIKLDDGLIYTR